MDLFSDPGQVGRLIQRRSTDADLPELFSVRQITTGSTTLTMPTHFAPTSGLASVLVGVTANNITNISNAPPPMPTGANWTSLASGEETGTTHYTGLHLFAKIAASDAESFGTAGTGTQRVACISIDVWPVPVSVLSLFNVAGATIRQDAGSNTSCLWPGLASFAGTRSRVISAQMTGAINSTANHVNRTDLTTYSKFSSGIGGVGVSGEVGSWAEATTTLGAVSRDFGIAIEVYHPGDI